MKIRSQIILAQLPSAVIIVLITFFFIFSLTKLYYKADSILVENFKSILSMQKLNDSVEELNNYVIRHPQIMDEKVKKIEIKISHELLTQEQNALYSSEEGELTKKLRQKWGVYKESLSSAAPVETIDKNYKDLKRMTDNIIAINQDSIIRKKDELSNLIIDYRFFISFSAFFSLVFGFFVSWVFTGLILSPLKKMTEIMSEFGKTDQTTLLNIHGSEELEKLSNEFNLMTNRLEEYHQSSLGHAIADYENLKSALDAPPYPILIFSHSDEIIFMNKAALRLFRIGQNINTENTPMSYMETSLRESLLRIVRHVQRARKPYSLEKPTEVLTILKEQKKNFFVPFAYPITIDENNPDSSALSVLVVLQDVRLRSAPERESEQVCTTFVRDIQEPLAEIQMALYTSLQEEIGPLTEKQKDILYAARDQVEELDRLYRDFLKVTNVYREGEGGISPPSYH